MALLNIGEKTIININVNVNTSPSPDKQPKPKWKLIGLLCGLVTLLIYLVKLFLALV